jgi:RNA polymerase sigma-70 factor (ECF subfamily)
VVQDTFISAMNAWRLRGTPDNPSAWLFRAARNKALDIIRKDRFTKQFDFSDGERALLKSEYTITTVMDMLWSEGAIGDDLLKMMFACCHPGISTENQITLMLKTLCGFSIAEIARAFLTSEQTIAKRLYRTKEFFREHKIRPEFPDTTQLKGRADAVLKTIYLLFNEGYNATHADELIRKDLLEQAMYLGRLLCGNTHTQLPEVYAAMSLMSFHAARVDSRTSSEGEIILLDQQDRSRWDLKLIDAGNDYMNKAAFGDAISSYHIEAAIAYEHCTAESYEQTDWQRILVYYDWLVRLQPTAVVMLNRMTIIYKIKGAAATLAEMQGSVHQAEWEKLYLYHSLMGEMFRQVDRERAREFFQKAVMLTHSKAEKNLLQRKMDLL